MKNFIQMTFAVFFGVLAAELVIDFWHSRQERIKMEVVEKLHAEKEKHQQELMEKIKGAYMQRSLKQQETHPSIPSPETMPQNELNGLPGQ
jgi:hypothetical protein